MPVVLLVNRTCLRRGKPSVSWEQFTDLLFHGSLLVLGGFAGHDLAERRLLRPV